MGKLENLKPFQKGNKMGKGRPKQIVSRVRQELIEKGYDPIRPSDVTDCIEILIALDIEALQEIVRDPSQPMYLRVVGKQILDPKHGFDCIEKMLDRAHGKPTQRQESNTTLNFNNLPEWAK